MFGAGNWAARGQRPRAHKVHPNSMCLDQADSRGWVGAPGEEMHVELWGFYVGNWEDESS